MARGDLTDREWERLLPLLPTRAGKQGRPYKDHRQVVNGMLWVLRTGAPWREMPERYGSWRTVYSRFRRWSRAGVFARALSAVQSQEEKEGRLDWSVFAVDGSYVKAHPCASGARKKGEARKTAGKRKASA